jgi:hypothetical protein
MSRAKFGQKHKMLGPRVQTVYTLWCRFVTAQAAFRGFAMRQRARTPAINATRKIGFIFALKREADVSLRPAAQRCDFFRPNLGQHS